MGNRVMSAGNYGRAYYFDGDDYIDCGNSMTLDQQAAGSGADFKLKYDNSNYWIAQGFKPGSTGTLAVVGLIFSKTGLPSGNVYLEIQTDDGSGKPSGTVVTNGTSASINTDQMSGTGIIYYFMFPTPPSLTTGTQYHIVVKATYSTSTTDYFTLTCSTSSVYADGTAAKSDNSGNWTSDADKDLYFKTYIGNGAFNIDGQITLEAWIYPINLASAELTIISKMNPLQLNVGGYRLYINTSSQLSFAFATVSSIRTFTDTTTTFRTYQWYHVAVTFDDTLSSNNIKFYVNGINTAIASEGSYDLGINTENLNIGRNPAGTSSYFRGIIDEVRVSNSIRTFTPGSINAPYSTDANTKLLLHFEGNANDSSGNGNNGTVTGATLTDEYGIIAAINDSTETTKIQTGAIGDAQITTGKIATDAVTQKSRLLLTDGNATTQISSQFVDLVTNGGAGTAVSITLTTGANRVLIIFNGNWQVNIATLMLFMDIAIDGTKQGNGTSGLISEYFETANASRPFSYTYLSDVLSAGSHTFKLQWRNNNPIYIGTIIASSLSPLHFAVIEIKK